MLANNNIFTLATLACAGVASAAGIRATVDGDRVYFAGVQPTMVYGHVMVPIRGVFEAMGAEVDWNENSQTVSARHFDDRIRLQINADHADVNGTEVSLESPAISIHGHAMVPLRFVGEAFGANVEWNESTHTVEIETASPYGRIHRSAGPTASIEPDALQTASLNTALRSGTYTVVHDRVGTVLPFRFSQKLSSNESAIGDKFTATIDTNGAATYQGLPKGTIFVGHVDAIRRKTELTPGVLGIMFDRVVLPNGAQHEFFASVMGLDPASITIHNGNITAKPSAIQSGMKYIGYGADAVVAKVTADNLTNAGTVPWLFSAVNENYPGKYRDVTLEVGARSALRLTQDLTYRIAKPAKTQN